MLLFFYSIFVLTGEDILNVNVDSKSSDRDMEALTLTPGQVPSLGELLKSVSEVVKTLSGDSSRSGSHPSPNMTIFYCFLLVRF